MAESVARAATGWARRLTLLTVFMVAGALAMPAPARDIAGHTLPDQVSLPASNTALLLNGAGVRSMFGFSVYLIALYLPGKAASAREVTETDGPRRIQIEMLHDASASQVTNGLFKSLTRNNSEEDVAHLQGAIDQFRGELLALKNVPAGTRFSIDYTPRNGTRLYVNGQPRGEPIAGGEFIKAVLKIWLGEQPTQPSLKEALLEGAKPADS